MASRRPMSIPLACALAAILGGCGSMREEDPRQEEYIFDPALFHHFDLEVDPDDWTWLQKNALKEEYVPATVVFEGRRYKKAAVRFKGAYGTLISCFDDTGKQICPKLSLKVSFNEYDKDGRFYGLRKLILNSSVRDPTLMHEVLGYHLFREMGVMAPRASHATVSVNGDSLGVFVLVEYVDKEFIQDRFDADEGNLYKEVWPSYGTDSEYAEHLRTNEEESDVSRMAAFRDALLGASEDSIDGAMEPFVDLDYMARYLAVDRSISNADGIRGFYCYGEGSTECSNANHYWYEVPDGPVALFPWDLDYTFGDVNTDLGRSMFDTSEETCTPISFCDYWGEESCTPDAADVYLLMPQCDPLYGYLHRATWDRYLAALRELVDGPMDPDGLLDFARSERDKIEDAVLADPYGPDPDDYRQENVWLDENLAAQADEIEKLLDENGR